MMKKGLYTLKQNQEFSRRALNYSKRKQKSHSIPPPPTPHIHTRSANSISNNFPFMFSNLFKPFSQHLYGFYSRQTITTQDNQPWFNDHTSRNLLQATPTHPRKAYSCIKRLSISHLTRTHLSRLIFFYIWTYDSHKLHQLIRIPFKQRRPSNQSDPWI